MLRKLRKYKIRTGHCNQQVMACKIINKYLKALTPYTGTIIVSSRFG